MSVEGKGDRNMKKIIKYTFIISALILLNGCSKYSTNYDESVRFNMIDLTSRIVNYPNSYYKLMEKSYFYCEDVRNKLKLIEKSENEALILLKNYKFIFYEAEVQVISKTYYDEFYEGIEFNEYIDNEYYSIVYKSEFIESNNISKTIYITFNFSRNERHGWCYEGVYQGNLLEPYSHPGF